MNPENDKYKSDDEKELIVIIEGAAVNDNQEYKTADNVDIVGEGVVKETAVVDNVENGTVGKLERRRGRPRSVRSESGSGEKGYKYQKYIEVPVSELEALGAVSASNKRVEEIARGYFAGNPGIVRKKDVRVALEKKVTAAIGRSGKLLVAKLFELINGIYYVDQIKTVQGKKEVRYYQTPPNLNAIIYALDRVLGKPKQLSVQANFSLSELLIKSQGNGNGKYEHHIGREDSQGISSQSDVFHSVDLGDERATDQGGM